MLFKFQSTELSWNCKNINFIIFNEKKIISNKHNWEKYVEIDWGHDSYGTLIDSIGFVDRQI